MNSDQLKQYQEIARQFSKNASVLQAIGDKTRQHIILCMMELPCRSNGGARVGVITEKTHLSRPAISHHIKILREAGIVGMRSEGRKNYYFLSSEYSNYVPLLKMFENVVDLSKKIGSEQKSLPRDNA
ncbi:MAG: winged helix-turn-helix transcriptional regulator [Ruminococcaceae bacterium]|nr:winged helix-turn-helix transcriptional regulator [Oscillospiraceae bacterium]